MELFQCSDNSLLQLQLIGSTYHHYFLDSLLSFYFLTILENLDMIDFDLNFYYEIFSTINQHNQIKNHFLSLILLFFLEILGNRFKKVFIDLICFITNQNFYVIFFTMDNTSFFRAFRRNKVSCHCWLNFPFTLSFMIIY